MKNCPQCNTPNEDNAAFCYSCGAPLQAKQAEQPAPPPQPEPAPTVTYDQPIQISSTPNPEGAQSGSTPVGTDAKNPAQLWLILNIVSLVVCCCSNLLFSVIGIVMGALGTSSFKKGDMADAEKKANISKIMFIISLIAGFIMIASAIVVWIIFFANSFYY